MSDAVIIRVRVPESARIAKTQKLTGAGQIFFEQCFSLRAMHLYLVFPDQVDIFLKERPNQDVG